MSKEPRSSAKSVLIATIATVVIGGGYWLVWHSPWLRVESVTITVNRDQVVGKGQHTWADPTLRTRVSAALPSLSGEPLVSVDGDALATKLRGLRGVKDAQVRRGWPHTVGVIVTPRMPVAVFRAPKVGKQTAMWQLVDSDAVVVATQKQPPRGWMVLAISPDTAGGRAAMQVWRELPAWLHRAVIHMSSRSTASAATVELRLRKGQTVIWGAPGEAARKAKVLRALLKYRAKVYDVSAPDLPTTRG